MKHLQTPRGEIEIRDLQAPSEMLAVEDLQRQVWGADTHTHPKEILIPVQHAGGLLAGAFNESGELVGFIFGFPTRDPNVQHSQLLATLPAWRGLGIASQLKWYQRAWCLERGIRWVRWTVDPLRAANAELNIRHLGGTARTYYPDYYGKMNGIDAGSPSDRLLVEWELDSPRVNQRAGQPLEDSGFPEAAPANQVSSGRPELLQPYLKSKKILLRIPEDFVRLAREDPDLALEWRLQGRNLMQTFFEHGYRVEEFTRRGGPGYVLIAGGTAREN